MVQMELRPLFLGQVLLMRAVVVAVLIQAPPAQLEQAVLVAGQVGQKHTRLFLLPELLIPVAAAVAAAVVDLLVETEALAAPAS
jgi:hypothetical protein